MPIASSQYGQTSSRAAGDSLGAATSLVIHPEAAALEGIATQGSSAAEDTPSGGEVSCCCPSKEPASRGESSGVLCIAGSSAPNSTVFGLVGSGSVLAACAEALEELDGAVSRLRSISSTACRARGDRWRYSSSSSALSPWGPSLAAVPWIAAWTGALSQDAGPLNWTWPCPSLGGETSAAQNFSSIIAASTLSGHLLRLCGMLKLFWTRRGVWKGMAA
mmetsp:Transcript_34991/g.76389  ORF Transcript_34991/g.76389 Transcript_34991/m.76389 type:complete len:219 (+) Transcript_34991:1394-2050(+)